MFKHFSLLAVVILVASPLHARDADDLIISEYIEGSSNNKYLEIFNGTGEPVDMDDYEIQIYSNGSSDFGREISLEGNLSPDDVFVLGHTSGEIYQESDMEHGWLSFNGNDAVVLFKKSTGTEIDVFGCIGEDPGDAWTADGALTTKDMTLRRDPDVTEGATADDNAEDFNTLATEWDAASKDDVSGLGQHPGTVTHVPGPDETSNICVYPDAANEQLRVESPREKPEEIRICNFAGKVIMLKRGGNPDSMNISNLKPGVYIATIRFENGVDKSLKFLKK